MAYALFYFHGNLFGPRLFFEAFVPCVVLVAAGALQLRWLGFALALSGIAAGNALLHVEVERYRRMPYEQTADALRGAEGEKKLIFVDHSHLRARARWTHYSLGMVLGDLPGRNGSPLFAHDLGASVNQTLIASLPDHTAYRLGLQPRPAAGPHGVALDVSLERHPQPVAGSPLTILPAARFPLTARPACGFAEPVDVAGDDGALRLAASGEECEFDLGRAPVEAAWRVSLRLRTRPAAGRWQLHIGTRPVGEPFDSSGHDGEIRTIVLGHASSAPGDRIVVSGRGTVDLLELSFHPASPRPRYQEQPTNKR